MMRRAGFGPPGLLVNPCRSNQTIPRKMTFYGVSYTRGLDGRNPPAGKAGEPGDKE